MGALPRFDFRDARVVQEWGGIHDISSLSATKDGMRIAISGPDPYLYGPPRNYPEGQPLWLTLRLKTDEAGLAQIFYFTDSGRANEADSVRIPVTRPGEWLNLRIPMPPLGPMTSLRIDPPGKKGSAVIESIDIKPRIIPRMPAMPKPSPSFSTADSASIRSGQVSLSHSTRRYGEFSLSLDGRPMASGFSLPLVGYQQDGAMRWLYHSGQEAFFIKPAKGEIIIGATLTDADGGKWQVRQRFSTASAAGAIDVETIISVSEDREVLFLPLLFLFPGAGSFGEKKGQALFSGLEYLDAPDASSSEKDIAGPGSVRLIPDTAKITFPLMAVQGNDCYVGLIWDKNPEFAAVFDSPDRLFASGGHAMGVVFPGSDGFNRTEGNLLPYGGEMLRAGKPLQLNATIIVGQGKSVVPAVKKYVELHGVPKPPAMDKKQYLQSASAGWLESGIGEKGLYRHAYSPGEKSSFPSQPAADAALFMEWLANNTADAALAARLRTASKAAIAQVKSTEYNEAGIAHIRYPVASLVYGSVAENVERVREHGRKLLTEFEPDGSLRYRPAPGRSDKGKTHFAPDANGYTAQAVMRVLEYGAVSGDPELIRAGLKLLKALEKFDNTVPRGAQTWEIPLHTPDILAAAWLVRAYTLGYELSGEKKYLERAVYWAWTGVPFVYLTNPIQNPAGLFATIAVFGATEWSAPNWIGLPVQWCGLVYADALYRLMRHDHANRAVWTRLADGITAAGIRQSYPAEGDPSVQGLLPDSFGLREGRRIGPAINPGTLQAEAVRFFGGPALYDFHSFPKQGLSVHVPGDIVSIDEADDRITFSVRSWVKGPYYMLVTGVKKALAVTVNGTELLPQRHQVSGESGYLIVNLEGDPTLSIGNKQ